MSGAPIQSIREATTTVVKWIETNTRQVVIFAVLGAVGGYVVNTLLLVFTYGGYELTGGEAAVGLYYTGEGWPPLRAWPSLLLHTARGALLYAVASAVVFSLFGYAWSVGPRQFGQDLAALPRQVGRLIRHDGARAGSHLLWGAAVALLARQVIGPAAGAVLALGLFVYLPSVLGQAFVRLVMRAVYAVARLVRPATQLASGGTALAVGLLGTTAALAVGFFIPDSLTLAGRAIERHHVLLVAAIACGVSAFVLGRGGSPAQAAGIVLGFLVPAVLLVFDVPLAWADDGGWAEGGRTLDTWIRAEGSIAVLVWGGSAVPPVVAGSAVGGALGSVMSGGGWDFSGLRETSERVVRSAENVPDGVVGRLDDPLAGGVREAAEGVADGAFQRPGDVPFEGIRTAAEGVAEEVDFAGFFGELPGDVSESAEETIEAGRARPEDRVIRDDASAFGGAQADEQVRQDPVGAFGGPAGDLIDPDTGEPLIVQDGTYEGGEIGMVWSEGEWVSRDVAAARIAERQAELNARQREIEEWQRESDEMFARNRAERGERYAAEREAEASARQENEARIAREQRIDQGLDRLMEDRLHDPAWMERWEQAQDQAMEGNASELADLYRDTLREEVQASAAEAKAEERYEQALAVGEWTARGVEMGARGAMMAVGGQVVAAHGVLVGVGAAATGMGSIQGASEGAEAQAQGKDATEVLQRTAGGFLSGAKDGAVGTITGLPGTSGAVRVLLPAATDAAETYIRTGDAGQALASGVIGAVGGAAGEGVDAMLPPGAAQTATGMVVNATAAGATAASQGGSFQEGFMQGLASDVATRAGGSLGGRAVGSTVEGRPAADERAARDALAEGNAQRRQPTTIEQQSAAVQALAQTQHDRVRTDADGRVVTDATGRPVTDSVVNARGALDQLRDTAGSRTGKTLDDPNHPGLRDAIVRTRAEALYGPADRATIAAVTPALQADGILRPGDRLVMDTFSTPGSTPSLGADRDARLVIERPRVDRNGQPMVDIDGSPQMQRIEVERGHWERQALSDFTRHTQAIATEGGRTITAESHPDYYQRMREGLERQGHRPEAVAQMTPQQVLDASGPRGRDHAWAEAHNQLFTDRFHMEASRGNTDQGIRGVVDPDGRTRADPMQVTSNTLDVGAGRAQLADPEGFSRMWQEKSDFYRNNPPEALAQSQKGIAQHMGLRDGYRAQGLEPPPLNPQTAQAMQVIARAPVGADATPAALARVEADLQAIGYRSTSEAMTAVAWQNEGLKWSRPVAVPEAPGGLRTSQIGALSRPGVEDETTGF